MKVTIRDKKTGKTKTMEQRYADVLVKMKRAEYVDGHVAERQVYQTKVMTASPVQATMASAPAPASLPEIKEDATAEEILASFGIKQTPPASIPEETTPAAHSEPDGEEPRRRGRPKKTEE